ncbi:HAD family hydrolase [Intestinimonas sp. HCP28S3_D6]|uniref:HAD family hydrolase n=1 Tax=Intestinimonas sp. HCP28S3_D6 TaxID=3438942 RepID=UPI003F8C43E0
MRYEAVIFDLDGTLLNTLDDLAASTNRALTHFDLPQRSLDEVRQFVGNGVEKLIRRAVPAGTDETLTLDCLEWFKKDYMVHMRDQTAPYPGILKLLKQLQNNDCKVGVVSNKFDGAVKELCREHFGGLLPVAIGERPGAQKKPARDLVDLCVAELGVHPDHCVYVGDSDVDIQTAANAGLPCLSVSWGFRSRDFLMAHGASAIIDTPEDLFRAL